MQSHLKLKNIRNFPSDKAWDAEMNVSLRGSFNMIKFLEKKWQEKKRFNY